MKKNFLLWMGVVLMALHGMTACTVDDVPVDNRVNIESLYGEWWLVGWNDGGTWFEVDTNYVSHRHMSLEFREVDKEVYLYAWSLASC